MFTEVWSIEILKTGPIILVWRKPLNQVSDHLHKSWTLHSFQHFNIKLSCEFHAKKTTNMNFTWENFILKFMICA